VRVSLKALVDSTPMLMPFEGEVDKGSRGPLNGMLLEFARAFRRGVRPGKMRYERAFRPGTKLRWRRKRARAGVRRGTGGDPGAGSASHVRKLLLAREDQSSKGLES